jgi:tetratricopeptide (TPR) repeat protein
MIGDTMVDPSGPSHDPDRYWPLGLVQREVVLVVVLAAAAVVLFGATRSLAEWTEATAAETAATWFERGQALVEAGKLDEGIVALRRAVARERLDADYVLALVRALSDPSQGEDARAEARRLLLQLREREPDRPEINFRLARLAAASGDVDEATRYYNHAIYGLEPDNPEFDRRRIRVELATLLLAHGERDRALGELFALTADVPDVAADRLELGRLFLRAGDARSALAQFTGALRVESQNASASAGAGEAALALGSFPQAERYLQQAIRQGATDPDLEAKLATVRQVRSLSPLAAGLVSSERVRRLRGGLDWAAGRIRGCAGEPAAGEPAADDPIVVELTSFRRQSLATLRETDTLTEGVALIARAIEEIRRRCPERDAAEEAWLAIAATSGASGQ